MKHWLSALFFAVSAAFANAQSSLYFNTPPSGVFGTSLYPGFEGTLRSEDGFALSASLDPLDSSSLVISIEFEADGGFWRTITISGPDGFSFEPGFYETVATDSSVFFGNVPASGLSVTSAGQSGNPFPSDRSLGIDFGRSGWIDILDIQFGTGGSVSAATIEIYQTLPSNPDSWSFESLSINSPTLYASLIPEPSAYAAILGTLGLGTALCARRRVRPTNSVPSVG